MDVYPKMDTYPAVQYVTLTAVPSTGFVFDRWSGHTEGISDVNQNPVSFAMGDRLDNSRVITAVFAPSGYPAWDINQDGVIDHKDLAMLGAHYGEPTSEPYPNWDTNRDGATDYKDLAMLAAHYGEEY